MDLFIPVLILSSLTVGLTLGLLFGIRKLILLEEKLIEINEKIEKIIENK